MEKERKKAELMGRIKWLGLLLGLVMYYGTVGAFGDVIAMILACVAATAFYIMCDKEKRSITISCVSKHLRGVLEDFGHTDNVLEIRSANSGLIVRVYLIGAGERAVACTKLILDTIAASWYHSRVWVTQVVDLQQRGEIPAAMRALDEELFDKMSG